jgi:hypothetical protein
MDWMARIQSLTEAEDFSFNLCIQTALGPTQPPIQWVAVALSLGVQRGRGVMLTTHPLLVPRLRRSRSYTSYHPNMPLWSVMEPLLHFTHAMTVIVTEQGHTFKQMTLLICGLLCTFIRFGKTGLYVLMPGSLLLWKPAVV